MPNTNATPKRTPWAKPSRHARAHLPLWLRYPKANRRIAWAIGVVLTLWLAGWALVPMGKGFVERSASEKLGRTVTIGAIDFKPWTLELTVRDITVAGATSADAEAGVDKPAQHPPLLTISRIYVDAELQSLLRFAPVVDAIDIEQPHLQLSYLGNGQYDAQDVIERLMAQPDNKNSAPPRLALYNVALRGGAITLVDRSVNTRHTVKAINLSLPFISTLSTHRKITLQPALGMDINGVHFQSEADATPFSEQRAGQVHWRWRGVNLAPYLAYWPASLPVHLKQATVDMDMTLAFEQHPTTALSLRGTLETSKVALTDRQSNPLLDYERFRIDIANLRPLEHSVHLSAISLQKPTVYINRDNSGALNWLALGDTPAGTNPQAKSAASANSRSTKPPAKAASSWQLVVDEIAVEQGHAKWADATLKPPVQLQAQAVDVHMRNLSWPLQQAAQLDSTVQLHGGTLALQGVLNPQGIEQSPPQSTPNHPAEPTAAPTSTTSSPEKTPSSAPIAVATPPTTPAKKPAGKGLPPESAQLNLQLHDVDVAILAPYLASYLRPDLTGKVDADMAVQWWSPSRQDKLKPTQQLGQAQAGRTTSSTAGAAPTPLAGIVVQAHTLLLKDWALRTANKRLVGWQGLALKDVLITPASHNIRIASVQLQRPEVALTRNRQGVWMASDWLIPRTSPSTGVTQEAPSNTVSSDTPSWQIQLDQSSVQGGLVSYEDAMTARPVQLTLHDVDVEAGAVVWPWAKLVSPPSSRITVSARMSDQAVAAATSKQRPTALENAGSLQYQGNFGWSPLSSKGKILAQRLPLHALDGYVADFLSIEMLRAYASYEGDVAWSSQAAAPAGDASSAATPPNAGTQLSVNGSARLDDVKVLSAAAATDGVATPAGEELLAWKSLQLQDLQVRLAPSSPPQVQVGQTTLNDFFARITLAANGQLNLGQILKKPGLTTPPKAANATEAATATGAPTPAQSPPQLEAAQASAPASTPANARAPAPVIQLGPTSLINGRVFFADNFIKPNYSADLSDLTGQLSGFSSQPTQGAAQLAQLNLRGIAEGSADLEITGQLNPLVQPLVLNIQGKMHNLDLPPLSPYAIKYAGHGIERGKLSVDVQYQVDPDGKLSASNRIVLNQLQFGDAVEGAPNSLPVRLAVALLADSKGVIDLDVPISGSINDPSFSVGPIVFKAIVNLIGKALVSPFTLLSKAIGGGDDLSSVAFAPGSSTLNTEAQANLQKVAKALLERPALQITITGTAFLAQEREGLQREQLTERLLAEKRRQTPDNTPAAALTITPAEREALIQLLYKKTDMPKPKNTLGFVKDIPVADMEKLLLANITPTPRMAVDLARQRAAAVQHFLLAQKLPASRVLVAAPTSLTQAPTEAKPWEPQAELNLSMR